MVSGTVGTNPNNTFSWGQVTWWKWLILGHTVFITNLFHSQFFGGDSWIRSVLWRFNLATEMNYAVWWSGICLFIAAFLFYRCRSPGNKFSQEASWWLLSGFAMCLCIDEIGSFHEKVIAEFGFAGLIPFAIAIGGGVCYAVLILYRQPQTRTSAVLVSLAILCFVIVAGLELVENSINIDSRSLKRSRLVIEEATELCGTILLIFAGLTALPIRENESTGFVYLIGSWNGIRQLNFTISALYVLHLVFYFGTVNLEGWSFRAGNPISIFPIVVFFLVSLRCFYLTRNANGGTYHSLCLLAVSLLLVSIGQTTNLAQFYGEIVDRDISIFIGDVWSWITTLLPFVLLVLIILNQKIASIAVILVSIIAVVAIMIMAFNESPRIATYYLFSGSVAFACFILLQVSTPGLREGLEEQRLFT